MFRRSANTFGFTLIEISIVLVVIGLIVGGVLVGQDLKRASEVRATISQVEKYQAAVNMFRDKYSYPPGDIPAGPAARFGFAARGSLGGQGDGNGIILGYWSSVNPPAQPQAASGYTPLESIRTQRRKLAQAVNALGSRADFQAAKIRVNFLRCRM